MEIGNMNDENASYFLIGLFAGVCLGGMTALLLAPESGRQLRRDIRKGSRRLARKAGDTFEDIRDRGEDAVRSARDVIHDATEGAKERVTKRAR
jgi:gas vesicle protein